MAELAAYCEARQALNLRLHSKANELTVLIDFSVNHEKYGSPEISLIIPVCDVPKQATLRFEGGVRQLKPDKFFMNSNRKELLVNVPVSAKSLQLTLNVNRKLAN